MRVLVIPDVHLKPWMFEKACEIMQSDIADRVVCLMDIPDDWGQELNLGLYEETYDSAIRLQKEYPDTLWCYGNHDLSYLWVQTESGFSYDAIETVMEKTRELKEAISDEKQLQYIHKIDNVLFMHGGLTHPFVKYYAPDVDYDDTDTVINRINSLGRKEMWDGASPIWYRPQYGHERMYKSDGLMQVVGHTPMHRAILSDNVLSCDVFSTYRHGEPIGDQKMIVIDTETCEWWKTQ